MLLGTPWGGGLFDVAPWDAEDVENLLIDVERAQVQGLCLSCPSSPSV